MEVIAAIMRLAIVILLVFIHDKLVDIHNTIKNKY